MAKVKRYKSSLSLPLDLHYSLKALAAKLRITLNEALEQAVKEFVDRYNNNRQ